MNQNRNLFFKDLEVDNEFNSKGFVVHGNISIETIKLLTEAFNLLQIPDSYGFGFNVGLNTELFEKRKKMQDKITELVSSEILTLLNNKEIFTATFMNKVPEKKHLLPAHQDWTFTNENKHDSVMCWIPLIDVEMENGCMCFVPYSNHLFNYIRPFPFPFNDNPVYQNANKLLGYMKPQTMKAGQMVFINHKTAHASFPNHSGKNRLAVGLSIAPKNEDLHVYCLNPENQGKTILKYKVDQYFLVNHPHPEIATQYRNNLPYKFLYSVDDEIPYQLPSLNWELISKFFNDKGLIFNDDFYSLSFDFPANANTNSKIEKLEDNQQTFNHPIQLKNWSKSIYSFFSKSKTKK
jgi:hypothetical protein